MVIRYVMGSKIYERLISLIDCESTKGKILSDYVCEILKNLKINVSKCIGTSTDGAANMQGQYNGFGSWLNKEVGGDLLNVWCYAHVLNLIMVVVTENNTFSINLFGLLNTSAVFFKESFIRMQTLRKYSKKNLTSIGKTRWWSKDNALTKIFGWHNCDLNSCVYIDLIMALEEMSFSMEFNSSTRFTAGSLLEKLIKFETVLTGKMYLKLFEFTSPLSKYLQTNEMDVVQAHRMVLKTNEELKKISRDYQSTYEVTNKFIKCVNKELERKNSQIRVENDFSITRLRLKQLDGEIGQKLLQNSPQNKFQVDVYNVIFDTAISSFEKRFNISSKLMADLACLHPSRFEEVQQLSAEPFERLSNYLKKFDPSMKQ